MLIIWICTDLKLDYLLTLTPEVPEVPLSNTSLTDALSIAVKVAVNVCGVSFARVGAIFLLAVKKQLSVLFVNNKKIEYLNYS